LAVEKESVVIVGKLGTSQFNAKLVQSTMVDISVIQVVGIVVCIVVSQGMTRRIVSN
jgi:hypothetical protein